MAKIGIKEKHADKMRISITKLNIRETGSDFRQPKIKLHSNKNILIGSKLKMRLNADSNFVRVRLIVLFLMGVTLLVIAIQQLTVIWTTENSLIPLKGTLQSCNTYITPVSNTKRYGSKANSQKAELIFYLNEHKKKFTLMENIGDDYSNEEYENINRKLNRSDSVTVWVKKSAVADWEPKVFKINTDSETILKLQTIRFKERPLALFLLLMGLVSIFFPIYVFYPKLFRK